MKTIIKVLSGLIILTLICITGIFGYNKLKENEDLKKQLNQHQTNQANADTTSDKQSNQNDTNVSEQFTNANSDNSITNNEPNDNSQNNKVNRNNVFDYVIKGINDDGGDTSLMKFREPTYDSSSGIWTIVATNKSNVGATYKINVDSTGHITMYEGINEDLVLDADVSLN